MTLAFMAIMNSIEEMHEDLEANINYIRFLKSIFAKSLTQF